MTIFASEYFERESVKLGLIKLPKDKKVHLVWRVKYVYPYAWDSEFDLYISLLGKVVFTNPRDVSGRLKNYIKNSADLLKLPNIRIKELKQKLSQYGWPEKYLTDCFFFAAEAESLAKGDIDFWLKYLQDSYLKKQGVELHTIQKYHEHEMAVAINGNYYSVLNNNEYQQMWKENENSYFLNLASGRAFSIVNDLLAKANSPQKLYAIGSGDDLYGVFLTNEEWQEVSKLMYKDQHYKPHAPEVTFATN